MLNFFGVPGYTRISTPKHTAEMLLNHNLIGGVVPRYAVNAESAALLAAQEALDTDKVHIITALTQTHVFYLAAPSRALTDGITSTSLAAALPGHPAHTGDGCYLLHLSGDDAVVAIRRGDSLRVLVNSLDSVQVAMEAEELAVIDCSSATAWRLETPAGRTNRAARKLSIALELFAVAWSVIATTAAACLIVYAGLTDDTAERRANQTEALVASLQLSQPLSRQTEELQRVSSIALKNSGWLESYELKTNKASFAVRFPSFVSNEAIKSLGPGIVTEFDVDEQNVKATLGAQK